MRDRFKSNCCDAEPYGDNDGRVYCSECDKQLRTCAQDYYEPY